MTLFTATETIDSLPESSNKGVSESKRKWIIIDGALIVEDAQQILIDQFVNQHEHAEFRNLFVNTKWKEVLDVAPMLVSYHPDIEAWAQSKAPWRFGLIFESDASFEELVEHWHTLIHCQHVGLEGSLSRLYDPIALYHLLNATEEARQVAWIGPMSKIWLPDYVEQHYFYAERPELADVTPLEQTQFTDPEWQGLTDAKRYASAYRLIQHVDDYFPNYWRDKQDKHAHIVEQLILLSNLGEVTLQGATHYMNILCRIGDVWNKKNWRQENGKSISPHEAIVSLLEQQQTQPLTDRLDFASQLALVYHLDELNNKEVIA